MSLFLTIVVSVVCGAALGWILALVRYTDMGPFKRYRAEKREIPPVAPPLSNVVDAAFEEIDRTEDEGATFLIEVPPTPKRVIVSTMPKQVDVPSHSCEHLSAEVPRPYRTGECSGTCWALAQRGRVCFWVTGSAANCPHFRPRVHKTRVKLTKLSA